MLTDNCADADVMGVAMSMVTLQHGWQAVLAMSLAKCHVPQDIEFASRDRGRQSFLNFLTC